MSWHRPEATSNGRKWRRRVVEAHHVDLKSAGGARHAGNLILLCKLHHDNYGRRLTRAAITGALRTNAKDESVRFGVGVELAGQTIDIVLADTGEIVKIFVAQEHIDYGLHRSD